MTIKSTVPSNKNLYLFSLDSNFAQGYQYISFKNDLRPEDTAVEYDYSLNSMFLTFSYRNALNI